MTNQSSRRTLKVGFDLDGVLLYNPLRLARPLVVELKRLLKPSRTHTFYIPERPLEIMIWRLFHALSFYTPRGFRMIPEMVHEGHIEAYLITARYSFLKSDLDRFVESHDAASFFKRIIYNEHNEQPHLYKTRVIGELGLDYFLEDNWNIVSHLSHQKDLKTRVLWLYNFMDRAIPYEPKFAHLEDALKYIEDTYQRDRSDSQLIR